MLDMQENPEELPKFVTHQVKLAEEALDYGVRMTRTLVSSPMGADGVPISEDVITIKVAKTAPLGFDVIFFGSDEIGVSKTFAVSQKWLTKDDKLIVSTDDINQYIHNKIMYFTDESVAHQESLLIGPVEERKELN